MLNLNYCGASNSGKGEAVKQTLSFFENKGVTKEEILYIYPGELCRQKMNEDAEVKKAMLSGYFPDAYFVINLVKEYFEKNISDNILLMIIDGWPRNIEQIQWYPEFVTTNSLDPYFFNVITPYEECLRRMQSRDRLDDNRASFDNKWTEHETESVPAIAKIDTLFPRKKFDIDGLNIAKNILPLLEFIYQKNS